MVPNGFRGFLSEPTVREPTTLPLLLFVATLVMFFRQNATAS